MRSDTKHMQGILEAYGYVNENALFRVWYKDHEDSKKWQKASLTMKDREALEKNAQKLKAQEGWYDVKVLEDGKDGNK